MNPNAAWQNNVQAPSPINVSNLMTPQNPVNIQPVPAPDTQFSINASIPTPQAIIDQTTAPTAAENNFSSLQNQIASLIGSNDSLSSLQNQQAQQQGIPGLTNTVNDLTTQIEGLNNQSLALQNEAQYTIPNAAQVSAEGRGMTAGGLAPLTASQLRMNQIKQGAIASQSLTVKSALYAAMGKYTIAKDAADKAAQAQFDQQQKMIDVKRAQLEAIKPALNREQAAQAAKQEALLNERQRMIDIAKEDKKTAIAMAAAALKNFPNDATAQFAAQQAIQESNKSQPDLQKIYSLVGQYQSDPIAVQNAILEQKIKQEQLRQAPLEFAKEQQLRQAQIDKIRADAAPTGDSTAPLYNGLSGATATAVRAKVNALKSEPVVQNFATVQEGYNFSKSLSDKTTNPADDQALIYSLAKALDPGSVVREGEYATAQKYAQSWVSAYGKGVSQAIAGTGFLSEKARKNIKTVIESKYKASKQSYDNLYGKYETGINDLTGRTDGKKFLVDYAINSQQEVQDGATKEWEGKTYKLINREWVLQ